MKGAHKKLDGAESPSRKKGERVLRRLSESETDVLLEKLELFARRRYRPPLNSEDLVMEAVKAVLEHRRTWNTDYSPFRNLCLIIISIASNESEKEKRTVSLDTSDGSPPATSSPALIATTDRQSPEGRLEAAERLRRHCDLLRRAVGSDGDSGRIVEVALDKDGWKPCEIAAALNMRVSDVHNAKRRMRRELARLLTRLWNE
jgi:DNA-directed RNA polymerase specialized sigma24 family protein